MRYVSPLVSRVVERAGGRTQASVQLGVTRETIRLWLLKGFPLKDALKIEQQVDGLVTAEEILAEARARHHPASRPSTPDNSLGAG